MSRMPGPYRRFAKAYPKIDALYQKLGDTCHEHGPLDERSRRFLKLGIAIGRVSEGAVKSHARKLLGAGASVEELRHAVLLGLTTIGFPNMIAAMEWTEDVIEAGQKKAKKKGRKAAKS